MAAAGHLFSRLDTIQPLVGPPTCNFNYKTQQHKNRNKKCIHRGQLIFRKISKFKLVPCLSDFKAKMHQIQFHWGSTPDPTGWAYSAPPDPLTCNFKGLHIRGRRGKGWEGKRREMEREGEGEERGESFPFNWGLWIWQWRMKGREKGKKGSLGWGVQAPPFSTLSTDFPRLITTLYHDMSWNNKQTVWWMEAVMAATWSMNPWPSCLRRTSWCRVAEGR